jgi:hypothetical protein
MHCCVFFGASRGARQPATCRLATSASQMLTCFAVTHRPVMASRKSVSPLRATSFTPLAPAANAVVSSRRGMPLSGGVLHCNTLPHHNVSSWPWTT